MAFFFFPTVEDFGVWQLIFMMLVYGFLLYKASTALSHGSEMLLIIYGPGVIGSLLIPLLGAVPDCAIILISGLGSGTTEEIQSQISVGVGTLVGSTVMLLTIPWAIGVYLGRREVGEDGKAACIQIKGTDPPKYKPLYKQFSFTKNCVTAADDINIAAKIMMISLVSYLIIQIPAFFYSGESKAAYKEKPYAIIGFVVCLVAFIIYSVVQYRSDTNREVVELKCMQQKISSTLEHLKHQYSNVDTLTTTVFEVCDINKDGVISRSELVDALKRLGFSATREEIDYFMNEMDVGDENGEGKGDGQISPAEFQGFLKRYMGSEGKFGHSIPKEGEQVSIPLVHGSGFKNPFEEKDVEEEVESYPELTTGQIKFRAISILIFATVVVCIVSDPMVDVVNTLGNKLGLSPFYVSFVVTPIASNASEIVTGLIFARKKTMEGISLMFASLHGAATMNSTLALCIFMGLIAFRGLVWTFSAEVITVIVVVLAVGVNGLKPTVMMWQAGLVLLLYPLSILLVWILESCIGLD